MSDQVFDHDKMTPPQAWSGGFCTLSAWLAEPAPGHRPITRRRAHLSRRSSAWMVLELSSEQRRTIKHTCNRKARRRRQRFLVILIDDQHAMTERRNFE